MTAVVEGSVGVVARSVSEAMATGVPAGAVVCASLSDGPVPGWLVVEETAVAGVERQCAVVRLDGCAVAAAGSVSEVKVAGDPVPTDGEMPAWASALAGAFWASRRYRAEAESARTALLNHEARLERIVDAAHEYANENSLCERFDEFCVEQGLRPRSRDWLCEVDATVRVHIRVTSHSADAAGGEVTDRMVQEAIAELGSRGLADAIQDHDIVDVEDA
ncbi:hypothetical protein [Mycolicibacterium tusciae]|uniref:hypothetical protein n=1 Tax=Mycolicibacterium tusciae TaxID=75922 RepID=UPI00024A4FB3|nr:hypothetical protein [Mycolicibacterium tusciae]